MAIDKNTISEVMREMGRKGGKKGGSEGGTKAAENMTPEERRARAAKASAVRWGKKKAAVKKGKAGKS
jgi:hypothetical protein